MKTEIKLDGVVYKRAEDIPRDTLRRYFPESNVELKGRVDIGPGTVIWGPSKVFGDVTIGSNCMISAFSEIKANDGRVVIGDNVRIQNGFFISGPSTIGDDCFIGVKVIISNDLYPPSSRNIGASIGRNCILGNGVIIFPRTTVGEGSVIGAGALVTKDIPPDVLAHGSPARPAGTRAGYEEKKRQWEEGEL